MILPLLALISAQDAAPAPAEGETEVYEIVVEAKNYRATLLFDRDVDGRLYNCRVLIPSENKAMDREACDNTVRNAAAAADAKALAAAAKAMPPLEPRTLAMPKLVTPEASKPAAAVGPAAGVTASAETERQRAVKLAPPPKDETGTPVIRFTSGAGNARPEEEKARRD